MVIWSRLGIWLLHGPKVPTQTLMPTLQYSTNTNANTTKNTNTNTNQIQIPKMPNQTLMQCTPKMHCFVVQDWKLSCIRKENSGLEEPHIKVRCSMFSEISSNAQNFYFSSMFSAMFNAHYNIWCSLQCSITSERKEIGRQQCSKVLLLQVEALSI